MASPGDTKLEILGEAYKIEPLDTLGIKALKADDISGDYAVDLAGHISLPLVGEVEAADLTTSEL